MRKVKCILVSKGATLKSLHIFNSKYRIFWKRKNHGDSKKISGCQGGGRETHERVAHGGFLGQENTLYDILMMGLYICPNPPNGHYQEETLR